MAEVLTKVLVLFVGGGFYAHPDPFTAGEDVVEFASVEDAADEWAYRERGFRSACPNWGEGVGPEDIAFYVVPPEAIEEDGFAALEGCIPFTKDGEPVHV